MERGPIARWVAIALCLSACTVSAIKRVSYWTEDNRLLEVWVVSGPNRSCAEPDVLETDDVIKISAMCAEAVIPAPEQGSLHRHRFEVRLEQPVGNRSVVDGQGQPAEACTVPHCE